jgi:16S rRNA processing protein RimM
MRDDLLEAGKIVNTHGKRGEVKILPWADTPGFIAGLKRLFIDGAQVKVLSSKVLKGCVIAALDGVDDIEGAAKLRDKTVFIAREDVHLEEGRHFIKDLVGLRAVDAETGADLGTVGDVLSLPANNVYVISGAREILIPAVPEFVDEINMERGYIRFRLIEGM